MFPILTILSDFLGFTGVEHFYHGWIGSDGLPKTYTHALTPIIKLGRARHVFNITPVVFV